MMFLLLGAASQWKSRRRLAVILSFVLLAGLAVSLLPLAGVTLPPVAVTVLLGLYFAASLPLILALAEDRRFFIAFVQGVISAGVFVFFVNLLKDSVLNIMAP